MPLIDVNTNMMLFLDPPRHTRLRGLVAQAFSARMVEGMRPHIQATVDRLLERVEGSGEWDVMSALANPLPGFVIAELLGVPTEDQEQFKSWANAYAAWLGAMEYAADLRPMANDAVIAMGAYLRDIAEESRRRPQADLITALVQAEEQGDRLSQQELFSTCLLLLIAGNETTTNLIGNGILTLLRHPDAIRQLRDDPALIRSAIEELLRYESPVQYTARIARQPLEVGGQRIEAGEWILLLLGVANRDPEQFPEPDRLDLARRPNRHLAFGHGVHFCLGAPLARIQGQIAIQSVVQRFPSLGLADEQVSWRPVAAFRGLEALLVAH